MRTVTDQLGRRLELTRLLGRGGEGAVYEVRGGKLAVKLITTGGSARREQLRNQLEFVRRLPLNGLPVARPTEMIAPPLTGYVMELLTGMAPLKSAIFGQSGDAPSAELYQGFGGLRRRLRVLARAAHVLTLLHAKGLAFGDPSPANIFVSEALDCSEVWLIDTDNLQCESIRPAGMFTPGYGAPELVSGRSGVTTLTDAFAFAVIAYQTLTLTHPFIGDLVADGEPELEEKAFAGELPWTEDVSDDRNRSRFGVQREVVLSPLLRELFERAFGPGRVEPTMRPGVAEWAERLSAAADATITCASCSRTFYVTAVECPWCSAAKPAVVVARIEVCDPKSIYVSGDSKPPLVGRIAASDGETMVITRRALGSTGADANQPIIECAMDGTRIQLKCLDDVSRTVEPFDTNKRAITLGRDKKTLSWKKKPDWRLHLGPLDELHRVMSFERQEGGGS